MIQISSDSDSNVIYTTSSGTLHKSDYDKLLPLVEDKIRHFGKVRLCFEMTNFSGWTADAMFKDIMFDIRHARDFEKVAMVGDKKWQELLTSMMKPFTPAGVRFFNVSERDKAREWVEN